MLASGWSWGQRRGTAGVHSEDHQDGITQGWDKAIPSQLSGAQVYVQAGLSGAGGSACGLERTRCRAI